MFKRRTKFIAFLMIGAVATTASTTAQSQEARTFQFDVPPQGLGGALRNVAARAGIELYAASDDVNNIKAPALHGSLDVESAISQLLKGTGLTAIFEQGAVIIKSRQKAADAEATKDIVVTGTHIRGSEPTAPTIAATRQEIEQAGQSNLGEYIRDLPQNFNGGQNPGIAGGGDQNGNSNVGSTSALNLRGLGPDATLTLINGHRVAYEGALQGVDISAIPLAALDHIEIVADGSSALYGSDAVAGVANVILRKDYKGLWTSARIAGTTDGGDFQQEYNFVTGDQWRSGGFMVAGDYNRASALDARDRSYTQSIDGTTTLIPAQRQLSGVLSGHQQITSAITFDLDGQYSRRTSEESYPLTTTSNARTNGTLFQMAVASWSATPTVKLKLSDDWRVALSGTMGRSRTDIASQAYTTGAISQTTGGFYDNRLKSFELRGDGTLLTLPGGTLGLAVGGGYRAFSLSAKSAITAAGTTTNLIDIDRQENVAFAYGELSLPIFGRDNRIAFANFLQLSAAVRYERYEGLADVASPKLGLVYRPVSPITIKGAWGKSFKAPTFYERYKVYQAVLLPASALGAAGAIANAPVLYLAGGNPNLKPERSTNWNVTFSYKPPAIPSLRLEANYFNVRYRNRVASPITSVLGLFTNPIYSPFITLSPSAAQLDALIAPTVGAFGLQNITGKPYDPATVYAVVDARSQNTAYQSIEGVDFSAQYRFSLYSDETLLLTAAASYLDSNRRLIAGQPSTATAGVIFMPPHWRARTGASWQSGDTSISAFVNYIAGVEDQRVQPFTHIGSFTSIDLAAHFALSGGEGVMRNVELTIAATNLSNQKPALIRQSAVVDPTYDSTNYPAAGRSLSLTIAKRW